MAFLTEVTPRFATPSIRENPYDGDIVINGVAYDRATMLPKVGKNEVFFVDFSGSAGSITMGVDDNDIQWKHVPLCIDGHFERTSVISLSPSVKRQIEDDRTFVADIFKIHACGRYDFHGRDWLEHPIKLHHFNNVTNSYHGLVFTGHQYGSYQVWDASNDRVFGIDRTYEQGAAGVPGAIVGYNDYGQVELGYYSDAATNKMYISHRNYSTEPQLRTPTITTLLDASGGTANNANVHFLTKMDNGDFIFFVDTTFDGFDIVRLKNSNNTIVYEFSNFNNSTIKVIPSTLVRHNESSETTNTNKKIFYVSDCDDTSYWDRQTIHRFTIDTAAGTIVQSTVNLTANTTHIAATYDQLSGSSTTYFAAYWDQRIIQASQSLTSQKWLFRFTGHVGVDDIQTQASNATNAAWVVSRIDAVNSNVLVNTHSGTWQSLLTASTRDRGIGDQVPWCIAPLNPEHTLMLVFCTFSIHLLKLDTSNGTLSEVWMDDNYIVSDVSWLPEGKVLVAHWDERKRYGTGNGVIADSFFALSVFTEDQIYNLDITPSIGYAEYTGTDIPATVTLNAYDASDARVGTQIRLEIAGPATWDNSTKYKDVTLDSTADTVENITITGDGQIEFRVLEIQSI